ncbi:MAG: methyl-accepting chemotaxis protein [Deltaproteobacteria bacterium]|nr:methyl-accepting chemotaxis protein [Deltaproteobacteria bacterium]
MSFKISNLSLRVKLIALFILTSLLPISVSSWITWSNNTSTLLEETENNLKTFLEIKGKSLEDAIQTMRSQVKTLAKNRTTVEAMANFSEAFNKYPDEISNKPSREDILQSLTSYYQSEFGNEFKNRNGGISTDSLVNLAQLKDPSLYLQYSYISENKNPLGSKDTLKFSPDGSSWSNFHKEYHSTFVNFLYEFGYYDVFLIEPENATIVYTVFKELDFATSLKNGPYSNTKFAEIAKAALNATSDNSFITDLETYYPSYNDPAGFIGAPIIKDGKTIGALVFQIPVAKLDAILTSDKKWKDVGGGETGETYILGKDQYMRSTSRLLIENKEDYFSKIEKDSFPEERLNYIKAKGTTTLMQRVNSESAQKAISGKSGFTSAINYLGNSVLSAYRPLNIKGVDWFIISEMTEEEALIPVSNLTRLLLIVNLAAIIIIALISFIFATTMTKNIVRSVSGLDRSATETLTSSSNVRSASAVVSSSVTEQASAIQETVSTLNEIRAMSQKSLEFSEKSSEKADSSMRIAKEGEQVVAEMEQSMADISDSNDKIMQAVSDSNKEIQSIVEVINSIAEKTNVINDIVFQTKLLSFNASVEAARAGEHGKGFAVVAEEVGNLAQMSGNAAKEISEMLNDSVKKVESIVTNTSSQVAGLIEVGTSKVSRGTEIANRCREVLSNVVSDISNVTTMMSEINSGAREISEGVSNISTAMNQLDKSTHANSDISHKTSGYAKSLADQANHLADIVYQLRKVVLGKSSESDRKDVRSGQKEEEDIANSADLNERKRSARSPQRDYNPVVPIKEDRKDKIGGIGESSVIPSASDDGFKEVS